MNEIISKIGKVEQLELFQSGEFNDVPDDELLDWINTGHQAIQMAVVKLTIHAAQVGAWLTVMKERKVHGEWEGWVAENCLFSDRTARRYMKLYRKLIELPKRTLVSVLQLPVNTAYRHLGIVKTPAELEPVETPPTPEGFYDVIVIDPPWPMIKIEREEAPEQEGFPYSPMSIDELKMLDVPCADNCHLIIS